MPRPDSCPQSDIQPLLGLSLISGTCEKEKEEEKKEKKDICDNYRAITILT